MPNESNHKSCPNCMMWPHALIEDHVMMASHAQVIHAHSLFAGIQGFQWGFRSFRVFLYERRKHEESFRDSQNMAVTQNC